jgi:type VI secretion system protein VasG
MLEAAVSRAASSRHAEVTVEHMLAEMLASDDGDAGVLLRQLDRNRARLLDNVETVLHTYKCDNPGKPVFSGSVFNWLEDAWLVASLQHGASAIRSGALFLVFINNPGRYSSEHFRELDDLRLEALNNDFNNIVAKTKEAGEARPDAGAKPGAPRAAAASDGSALLKFTTSFTDKARAGQIDPIFGRHKEVRQLIDILSRRRKNNPIIVGEPGVGKTALAEGIAIAIVQGDVPEELREVDFRNLDLGLMQAGAGVKGEFENRLKKVIADVKSAPKPVILFIDEAHTLVGGGAGAGQSDAANILKPELARGELRTVAATTWTEYKKYFEKDPALERRFQPVKVDEPSVEAAIGMLRGLAPVYEREHGVTVLDEAVVAAVKLSERYVSGRQLPDKAVDVIDTAAARVRVEIGTKPESVVALEAELASLERARNALKRDIDSLHAPPFMGDGIDPMAEIEQKTEACRTKLNGVLQQWEKERAAVKTLIDARKALLDHKAAAAASATPAPGAPAAAKPEAAPAPADPAVLLKAVDDAKKAVEDIRGDEYLVHGEVDADVVAQVVANWTGIPVGKMKTETLSSVLSLEEQLTARVKGQTPAITTIAETIRMSFAGIRNMDTPVGVLLFVGPSGVGKTEAALTMADTLFGGERFLTAINMSEFQEKHTVSRLIGSPPGYVGFGQGGVLTEAVRQRPYSVVLLDECEKADLEVMNLFYQVFDKGILNDGEGRSIDFKNTVIVLTSNLATNEIVEAYSGDAEPDWHTVIDQIRPMLSAHFKPALLGRMTIVPFRPLNAPILKEITELKLSKLAKRLWESHKIKCTFAKEAIDSITKRCTAAETGARNIDFIMRSSLMPTLARDLLELLANDKHPRHLEIGISPAEEWRIEFGD